jgi:hypothetical protein
MRISMTPLLLAALLTATAAPAAGHGDRPAPLADRVAAVDRLFPETAIEGEGWRGLLPIMLFNLDPGLRIPSVQSERGEAPTR